jgi:Prealbumin-like fold domain
MLEMSVSSLQIAIAGRVLKGETDEIVVGAVVEMMEMPEKFRRILSLKKIQFGLQWEKMGDRLDRKITSNEGYFYFTNLPIGTYVLEASLPISGSRHNKVRQTVRVDKAIDGKIFTTMTNIGLPKEVRQ